MSSKQQETPSGGMTLGDIYFTLFRHKRKILLFSTAGILAALMLLIFKPPLYESKTEVDILYVLQGKSFSPPGEDANTVPLNSQGYGIILTEVKILQSLDVVKIGRAHV
jgi:polysaccharide biosynthesis transport protein